MTAIALVAAEIGVIDPLDGDTIIDSYIASVAITKGQAIYSVAATSYAALADASAAGTAQFRGISLNGAAIGGVLGVCRQGRMYGFTLTGNYAALAYLSDTAGGLDDGVGTVTVNVGRIVHVNDKPTFTKVLRVQADMLRDWS